MTTTTKLFLGVSIAAFLTSLTGALWGLFLPFGAIFFGLFMIFNLLGKEARLFDEEQSLRFSLAEKNAARPQRTQRADPETRLAALSAH